MHAQRVREDENYIRRLRKLLKCGEEAFTDDGMVKDETGHGDTRQNTEIKDCIWKAFKIRSRKDFEDAMTSSADAVILDNGYGTGETFDWSILEGAGVMMQEKKFFLAGGLQGRYRYAPIIPDPGPEYNTRIVKFESSLVVPCLL